MMKFARKWFTLVELVITITIMVILWSIGLLSYNAHLSSVRDSSRLAQIESLYNWLKIYSTKNSMVPEPENKIDVVYSWSIIWYEWYAWTNTMAQIWYKRWWKDPKDKVFFSYYTNQNRKYFQIMTFLEEEKNLNVFVNKTYATLYTDYAERYVKVLWNKIWMLVQDVTNLPLNEVESIKLAWELDVWTTTDVYRAYFIDDVYIRWDNTILAQLSSVTKIWWLWCTIEDDIVTCTN